MRTNDDCPVKGNGESIDLDQRDVRALTECMSVLAIGGGIYDVVSESGNSYRVDAIEGRCECPDATHNLPTEEGRQLCKHAARTRFATGERPIPAWADPAPIDPQLGAHVDATPVVVATDGGARADPSAVDESSAQCGAEAGDRPDDCACTPTMTDLCCWPCFRDGHETPADVTDPDD